MNYMLPAPIETARLTIRLIEQGDLDALFEHHSDLTVTRYIPHVRWAERADADPWFARVLARREQQSAVQCVIVRRATVTEPEAIIGTVMLFNFDRDSGLAELGYLLGKDFVGRGYATEAVTAFINFAFAEPGAEVSAGGLGLRRLEAIVDARNDASNQLAERLGFMCEGVLRERWRVEGQWPDVHLFALLKREWRGA